MIRRFALLFALAGLSALLASAEDKTPAKTAAVTMPGINAPDKMPKGCVDCHVNPGPDGKDHRLPAELGALKAKHPDITKIVKAIPADCGKCHKDGSKAGTVAAFAHKVHLGSPTTPFIAQGGSCVSCHALDVKTGKMSVKSGAPNW